MASDFSIVEFYSDSNKYRCGYCKKTDSIIRHGMWAHQMSVENYQNLIDRGWRRSGSYCYKPTMAETCCPMYTIKCAALDFRPTKSQKKVLKQMHRFLASGDRKRETSRISNTSQEESPRDEIVQEIPQPMKAQVQMDNIQLQVESSSDGSSLNPKKTRLSESAKMETEEPSVPESKGKLQSESVTNSKISLKAKFKRRERHKEKLISQGLSNEEAEALMKSKRLSKSQPKKIEEFINAPLPENPAHRLEVRTVTSHELRSSKDVEYEVYQKYQTVIHKDPPERCSMRQFTRFLVDSPLQIKLLETCSEEFEESFKESWALYTKYQMAIHNDPREECTKTSYSEFLVTSPMKYKLGNGSPPRGYGSFHQQYWLDGKLIAVGVLDILPKCVSSVYFFYDPDYKDLTLGTYGSLREVMFVRSLQTYSPNLRFYYMGYYIHSCPKMRYKAKLAPSYLLCPETYVWFPIEECLEKLHQLDKSQYCRFNPDPSATDPDDETNLDQVTILFSNQVITFPRYISLVKNIDCKEETEKIREYASLVGKKCASRLLLIRSE